MSAIYLVASDYPIPFIDMQSMKFKIIEGIEIGVQSGLMISDRSYLHGCFSDANTYISKQFKYDLSLEADVSCVDALRQYLKENMRANSEIEIWCIWLGSGFKEYYKYKTPIKHIPYSSKNDVEDSIDEYIESEPVIPKHRKTTIHDLQINDILFIINNYYVCLSIKKDSTAL